MTYILRISLRGLVCVSTYISRVIIRNGYLHTSSEQGYQVVFVCCVEGPVPAAAHFTYISSANIRACFIYLFCSYVGTKLCSAIAVGRTPGCAAAVSSTLLARRPSGCTRKKGRVSLRSVRTLLEVVWCGSDPTRL